MIMSVLIFKKAEWPGQTWCTVYLYLFLQINCVVMRGINEEEVCDFVSLTKDKVHK